MSVILGIDPGKITGWCFHTTEKGVVDCGTVAVDPHGQNILDHPIYQADIVIYEHPQIYRPKDSKGNPNDLAGLIFQVGRWWQYYGSTYRCTQRYVLPHEWKGQLSKDVCAQRVFDSLRPEEQVIVSRCGRGLAKKPLSDMMDAVGLALHAAGRGIRTSTGSPGGRS